MESKYLLVLLIVVSFVSCSGVGASSAFSEEDFQVDTIFLKNMIRQGGSVSASLSISNPGDTAKDFQLWVEDFDGVVNLNESRFEIGAGDSKDVTVVFIGNGMSPGVYVGKFVVGAGGVEKVIPIILEVQSEEVSFTVNLEVGTEYKEVSRGDVISVPIRLFNLNDTLLHDVDMSYSIRSFDGERIVSNTEIAVAGEEVLITKNVALPLDIKPGDYAFSVVIRLGDSVSTSSYLFSVVDVEGSFFDDNFAVFALIIIIFSAGIIILIVYLIYERGRAFRDLKKQNRAELRRCVGNLKSRKKKRVRKSVRRRKKS